MGHERLHKAGVAGSQARCSWQAVISTSLVTEGLSFSLLLHIRRKNLKCGSTLFLFFFPVTWGFSETYRALIFSPFIHVLNIYIYIHIISCYDEPDLYFCFFFPFNPSKILIGLTGKCHFVDAKIESSKVTHWNNTINWWSLDLKLYLFLF